LSREDVTNPARKGLISPKDDVGSNHNSMLEVDSLEEIDVQNGSLIDTPAKLRMRKVDSNYNYEVFTRNVLNEHISYITRSILKEAAPKK
jgi:hypothetical protein